MLTRFELEGFSLDLETATDKEIDSALKKVEISASVLKSISNQRKIIAHRHCVSAANKD